MEWFIMGDVGGVAYDVVLETVSLTDTTASQGSTLNLLYALKVHNVSDNTLTFDTLDYTVTGNINHYDAVLQAWLSVDTSTPDPMSTPYWEAASLTTSPKNVTQDVTGLSGNPFVIAAGGTKYILITANINGDAFVDDDMQVTDISISFTAATVQHELQTAGRIITITA